MFHYDNGVFVTQYNKRYILSTFEEIENVALSTSNRRFSKLSNDTKFMKIEVTLLKVQLLQSCINFLLFSLYFTHHFVHCLRINLADKMYLLLYWVTFIVIFAAFPYIYPCLCYYLYPTKQAAFIVRF